MHPNAINDTKFYLQRFSDQLKLDPKHKYYYQVQMQLPLCEVNYRNFVVWTLLVWLPFLYSEMIKFSHLFMPSRTASYQNF